MGNFLTTIKAGANLLGSRIVEASPDILTYTGIALLFAAGVKAALDTRNVEDIIDEQNDKIDEINESHTEDEMDDPAVKRELSKVKVQTVGRIIWNYKWTIGIGVTGAAFVLYGHHIIKGRLVATTIAANSIQKMYDIAMDRVQDKWGESGLKYVKYGVEEIEEDVEVEDEDGNKHTEKVKKDKVASDPMGYEYSGNPYLIVIDEDDPFYRECGGSIVHMRSQAKVFESSLQQDYNAGMVISLNDIRKWFKGPKSDLLDDAGQVLGYNKNDPVNRANNREDTVVLNVHTFYGSDPETGEDKLYLAIAPNIPGVMSFCKSHKKSGKYIAA